LNHENTNTSLCFLELFSTESAEKLRTHLQLKKVVANFTSTSPNPFRTMPKETPHRQTSPPASRGYSYPDRGQGRGAYTRGRGNSYPSRGQAYQNYGGYRGRGQQRAYNGMQPPPVNMNIPFGSSFTGGVNW
jgi:hypothetical protein